jgi:hypothetical protein
MISGKRILSVEPAGPGATHVRRSGQTTRIISRCGPWGPLELASCSDSTSCSAGSDPESRIGSQVLRTTTAAAPPEASGEDVRDPLAAARRVGWVLFGLQLVAMVVFSTVEYRRFALTKDFAAYSQAMWALSHGHLDPFSTVFATQFWRNNGEFLLWPLSLPYRIYPHPIVLLWLQAVVVVLTGVVTFHWVLDVLRVRSPRVSERTAVLLAMAVPVVLVLDPWAYETIAFDFHTHVFAAFFLVLAGRDLWSGRHRRLWCWVPFIFLSNAPGALYVAGLGLTGVLAGRRTRVAGASLIAAGAGWFLLLSAVGGDGVGGRGVSAWYGYLVGPHHGPVGVPAIAFGALSHPGLVGHMIELRWLLIVTFLLAVGLVGVCSPWGFGVALVVFLPSALAAPTDFLRFDQSFQSWAALPFVLIGSLMIVLNLLANGPVGRRVATGILVGWGICVVVLALAALRRPCPASGSRSTPRPQQSWGRWSAASRKARKSWPPTAWSGGSPNATRSTCSGTRRRTASSRSPRRCRSDGPSSCSCSPPTRAPASSRGPTRPPSPTYVTICTPGSWWRGPGSPPSRGRHRPGRRRSPYRSTAPRASGTVPAEQRDRSRDSTRRSRVALR